MTTSPNGKPHRQARNRGKPQRQACNRGIDNTIFQRSIGRGNQRARQNDDHNETINSLSQISFGPNTTFNQYYPDTTQYYNKPHRLDRKKYEDDDNSANHGYTSQAPRNTGVGKPEGRYVIPARRRRVTTSNNDDDNSAYQGYTTQPLKNTGVGKPEGRYVIPARRHCMGTSNNEDGCNKFNRSSLDANNYWDNFTGDRYLNLRTTRHYDRYHCDNTHTSYRRSSGGHDVQLHTEYNPIGKTIHD